MNKLFRLAIAAVLTASPAGAEDNTWRFELTPYLWMSGVNGDVAIGDLEAPLEVSFRDAVEDLELGFIGHFEARNDQWAVFTDLVYFDLGAAEGNFDFDFTEVVLELGAGYRLSPAFEVIGGIRYWNLDAMLARVIDPRLERVTENNWVDPFVGGRFRVPLADAWTLGVRADIGGFGAGSDFSWNLRGIVDWQAWRTVSLRFGYRALDVDYSDDGDDATGAFKFDAITHGPVLAVTFHF